jgi:hypothetical protein
MNISFIIENIELSENYNYNKLTGDATRITAEMKYMRRTAGYTRTDHKTNTEIPKELNINPILDKIQN